MQIQNISFIAKSLWNSTTLKTWHDNNQFQELCFQTTILSSSLPQVPDSDNSLTLPGPSIHWPQHSSLSINFLDISSVSTLPNLSFMVHHFNPWDKSSTFLLPFPSVLLNQKNTTASEICLQTPYLHPRSGMQPNRYWNCTDSYLNFGAMSLTWALSEPYYMSQVNSQILG